MVRQKSNGTGLVDERQFDIHIINGAITNSPTIEPGPASLTLSTGGRLRKWDVVVPEGSAVDLWDLIEQQVDYDPPVVSKVFEYVQRAEAAADRAEQGGGTGGGGIFLDADGVPYFDTTATGGGSIALDADGVPYVTGV
ncbi:hypothetical protein IM25_06520 [Rhodococcus sp. p52]|uniref:hypothetical protein n=1 Tax=Rhodococcus sp. p52 TaxID=935199 RepID=UPI00051A70F3|nr:hypothetical protein [Rhodococcus sp. p52]AOD21318.1 hypothetical protein IM25_06520 [Rhodococcus sp. p52]